MSELKAIILADSYDEQFNQLCNVIPKSLFPFVDDILLEHQINWLQKNDVNQIIILYRHQKIADYINNRKKSNRQIENIELINILDSKNMGDALRELNSHKIIQSDFIFLYGDIFTNIKLKDVINKYFLLKQQDKMNILLMAVHQGIQKYDEEKYLYVLENQDRLCQLTNLNKQKIVFNKERIQLIKGYPNKYTIRTDLIESGIYICSRDVLKSFEENFMFADIKDDFMKEILTSEIQEEKFNLYISPKTQVSQRIFNTKSYHQANLKYLSRFFHPFCPAQKYYIDFFKYQIGKLDPKSKMSDQSFLGQNSIIKQKTTITKSIIGKNCKIGQGCEIINSILWDNIQVDDNVIIKDSLITSDLQINQSVQSHIITTNSKFSIQENDNQLSNDESDSQSDNPGQHKNIINQNQYTGIQEDMQLILDQCETKDQVAQAILNVDTIKVNKNISFEEIVKTFLTAFLLNLQPNVEFLKEQFTLWEEFFTRFVSETENECYLKTIETFCRSNEQFHLTQLLQLSYQHQILREQIIIDYHLNMEKQENDNFAQNFIQSNQQFKDYLEQKLIEQQELEQENNEDGEYEYQYEYVYE